MKIYIAHPISGLSYEEVENYFLATKETLEKIGYTVFHPMVGKSYLRTELEFKASGYGNPESTNKAIVGRDRWMVETSDIVLIDLTRSERVSIGCVCEISWAKMRGKHIVLILEEGNIHNHAFILEQADIIYPTWDKAVFYLIKLFYGEI